MFPVSPLNSPQRVGIGNTPFPKATTKTKNYFCLSVVSQKIWIDRCLSSLVKHLFSLSRLRLVNFSVIPFFSSLVLSLIFEFLLRKQQHYMDSFRFFFIIPFPSCSKQNFIYAIGYWISTLKSADLCHNEQC